MTTQIYSRICIDCQTVKPVDEFQSNGKPSHPVGIAGWKARCHVCHERWKADRQRGGPRPAVQEAERVICKHGPPCTYVEQPHIVKLCPTCRADFDIDAPPLWHCPVCDHHWDESKIATWKECANCHEARPGGKSGGFFC